MNVVLSPRRFARPIRTVLLIGLVLALVFGTRSLSFIRLPDGPCPLFDFGPGQSVVVLDRTADRSPGLGDAVLYGTPEGRVAIGRIVAFDGHALEVDRARGRVRRENDAAWYPIPLTAIDALPVRAGQVLVLAEEPRAAVAGAVVAVERLVGRVLVALPF